MIQQVRQSEAPRRHGIECAQAAFHCLTCRARAAQVKLPYHIRVLIPCYKEELEIVQKTVIAARTAILPEGVLRTIYLCDDGKDPEKRAWVNLAGPRRGVRERALPQEGRDEWQEREPEQCGAPAVPCGESQDPPLACRICHASGPSTSSRSQR